MGNDPQTLIELTVVGKDRKGVVADITNFIFRNGGNVENVNQKVIRGLFGMHLEASFPEIDKSSLSSGLSVLSKKLDMEIRVHYEEPNRLKNIAILVTKEEHCLEKILYSRKRGEIDANISVIIGNDGSLRSIADEFRIPFHVVSYSDQIDIAERSILDLIEQYNIDLIVLARYMRILTPNFVWRYPNRIINIHPSLLPAFPGALAYAQAYERGAKIIGCTAHFVTDDLDQGPIICQDAFKVLENDTLDTIKSKGRDLEASTLLNAIQLYLDGRLEVYWGKVFTKSHP
ncbi:MAG: formyltetrahydrofolate deformylase [Nitrososphaeraceae archaeon]|jgi:formyltetrahydrofolate deformylase